MAINLKKTTKKDIAIIKGLRLGVASAGVKDDASDLLVVFFKSFDTAVTTSELLMLNSTAVL